MVGDAMATSSPLGVSTGFQSGSSPSQKRQRVSSLRSGWRQLSIIFRCKSSRAQDDEHLAAGRGAAQVSLRARFPHCALATDLLAIWKKGAQNIRRLHLGTPQACAHRPPAECSCQRARQGACTGRGQWHGYISGSSAEDSPRHTQHASCTGAQSWGQQIRRGGDKVSTSHRQLQEHASGTSAVTMHTAPARSLVAA